MVASDRILDTSVTWTEFETNLREAFGNEARLGPKKAVLDIGEGHGFASCCGLITCDWIDAAVGEKLPEKVVIKIPSIIPLRRLNESTPEGQKMFAFDDAQWAAMEQRMNRIHNTEVAFYEFLDDFDGCTVPRKFYGKAVGDGGQLCFSYVANSRTMNFYERHTVEQVTQIARALGKIQACSLKKELSSPELHTDFFKMIKEIWPIETFRGMFKGIIEIDDSEKTKELTDKIDALVQVYHGSNIPTTIHTQLGLRPVIVNGDLHTGNVLIDKDSGDLLALIDWQSAHLGVGVEDLHRIAMSALTTEDRRTAMPMLVEVMYKSMVENLDGAEAPYSLETLSVVSDLVFPVCALFFVGPFIAFLKKIEKDDALSDDEKAKHKEVLLDKATGILEDIIEIDGKNNKNNDNANIKLEYA